MGVLLHRECRTFVSEAFADDLDGNIGLESDGRYLTRKFFRIVAEDELPEGDLTILYEFEVTGKGDPSKGNGTPGTGSLYVNGEEVGSVDMDVTVPFLFSIEGLSVSHDYGDSVDHANYKPPFPFTGKIKRVTYDLSGDAIHNAEAETRRAMSKQ